MIEILTKTQAEELIAKSELKRTHNVGQIYPEIFENDEFENYANGKLKVGIIWLGSTTLDNSLFPRMTCPVCGKEEALVPYCCVASILSGAHTISFCCASCGERIVYNHISDYYHLISGYMLKNRDKIDKPFNILRDTGFI